MEKPVLDLKNITHSFGLNEVLSGVTLNVAKGEVVSLVGPSGCGKTTLMSMCAGILDPSEGCATNTFRRTSIVFQDDWLLPWRPAWKNISFGLKAAGVSKVLQKKRAVELARRLRLTDDDLDKYPHELSGGMCQRIALGRALAVDPDLLLLDEPFIALDIGLRRELQDLVIEQILEQKLTALLITHDLLEAVRISSRILVLKPEPGRVVKEIEITEPFHRRHDSFIYEYVGKLLGEPEIRDAFGLVRGQNQ